MQKKQIVRAPVGRHARRYYHTYLLLLGFQLGAMPVAHAVDYEPLHVGGIELLPNFNTKVTPTGSVLLANGEEENSELLLFKPRVTALLAGERRQLSSTLELQNGIYSAVGDAGYVDWKLENIARFEFDGQRSIRLRTEHFNTHEGAGQAYLPDEERDPARFTTQTFDAGYEQALWQRRGQLVLEGGTFAKDYVDAVQVAGLAGQEDRHFASSLRLRVLPTVNLQWQYRARDISYGPDSQHAEGSEALDRRELFSYVGATWEPALQIGGDLRVVSGYKQTQNREGQALADTSTWEANLRWRPLDSSTLTFAAEQSASERPSLGRQDITSSFRYNWEYRWANQVKSTLAGSYSRKLNRKTLRTDEGQGFKLRLDYAYAAWVDMFMAFGHDRRTLAGDLSFSQQTVMLGIAASLDRFFGR